MDDEAPPPMIEGVWDQVEAEDEAGGIGDVLPD